MRPLIPIALLAALVTTPASGQTPEVLACMDNGYSEDEQAVIDNFVATFDLDTLGSDEALAMVLGEKAADCAGEDFADDDALIAIIQYQFARLSLAGIDATRPDILEVMRRIDSDLEPAARTRLFELFEISVFGDPATGEKRELTLEEEKFFNDAILDPPVSGRLEQSELIGAYMAGRVMMRDAVEEISAR